MSCEMVQYKRGYEQAIDDDMPRLVLRPVTLSDAGQILLWRNDTRVRSQFIHPEAVTREAHQAWCERVLVDPAITFLMAETLDGTAAGTVRFDCCNSEALVSLYLNPACFGQGLGTAMLREGVRYMQQQKRDLTAFVAQIKADNLASINAFRRCGFYEDALINKV